MCWGRVRIARVQLALAHTRTKRTCNGHARHRRTAIEQDRRVNREHLPVIGGAHSSERVAPHASQVGYARPKLPKPLPVAIDRAQHIYSNT